MTQLILRFSAIALVALVSVVILPGISSAQYSIPYSVLGNGGGEASDSSYNVNGTVGQPAIGAVSDSSYTNGVGFWYLQNYLLTGIQSKPDKVPTNFQLYQNYPNPFNPSTIISYQLAKKSQVTLTIYDILGRRVATLVNQNENAGSYDVRFDGSALASGVYFYRLEAGSYSQIKKLMLLK